MAALTTPSATRRRTSLLSPVSQRPPDDDVPLPAAMREKLQRESIKTVSGTASESTTRPAASISGAAAQVLGASAERGEPRSVSPARSSRPVSRASGYNQSLTPSSAWSRPPSRALQMANAALEEENRCYRRAHTPLHIRRRMLIGPADSSALARPLSPGLLAATQFANFSELDARNIWEVPETLKTRLRQRDVDLIFRAKCVDQHCEPSFDRAQRFHELLCQQCCGTAFVLRQCGLGVEAVRAVSNVLMRDINYTLLDLSGNSIGKEGGQLLANLLRHNDTLVVLSVQSCQLGEGLMSIADALQNNRTLTALDVSGIAGLHRNSIWGDTAVSLGIMLQTNTVLSHLNFAHCGLSQAARKIIRCCTNHTALTYLNLSGNKIGNECCGAVATLLQEGTCDLLTLLLDENGIGDLGCEQIGAALGSGGKTSASLVTLSLARNNIGSRGALAIAPALREHSKLASLCLSFNQLCSMGFDADGYRLPDSLEGISALFTALETAPALQTFALVACGIAHLPPALVTGLRRSSKLEKLNLSENPFGDAGAEVVSQAITGNRTIKTLAITHCKIGLSGGRLLADAVERHRGLQHLRIQQGDLDSGRCGLIDAIRHSKSILTVDFPKEAREEVRGTLRENRERQVQSAGPELAAQQVALQLEAKALVQTQEMIVEEVRRREKLTETFKAMREKQKAASAHFKAELQDLHDQLEHHTHTYRTLEKQVAAKEEELVTKQRVCDQEQNKLKKRTEHVIVQREEIVKQVEQQKKQLESTSQSSQPSLSSPPRLPDQGSSDTATDELTQLQRELQIIHGEIAEHKRIVERFQQQNQQQQQQQQPSQGTGRKAMGSKRRGSSAKKKKK